VKVIVLRYKEIFLAGECNNACLHCSSRHKTTPPSGFEAIASEISRREEDGIVLVGGEPTIRNDIFNIFHAARANGYRRIKLITNGRAFSDMQYLERIVNAGCALFEIKLWASNPSLHDHLTRSNGSFWETMQGLENLAGLSYDTFVCLRIPVCKENFADLENAVSTALNFGVNRIILSMQDYSASFQSVLPHIANAVNISIFNRTWILTEGIPFCMMPGLEPHIGELLQGLTGIYERTFQHHKQCIDCIFRDLCPGIEVRYPAQFIKKEISPVKNSRYLQDMKALYV
jgi:sulfatase maturation enzyme AslB (radical SAM superfamily)